MTLSPPHASDSSEQRAAEIIMIAALSARLSMRLSPANLTTLDGCRLAVDGFSDDPPVICEAFARIGSLKSGQVRKVDSDVLKLLYLARLRTDHPRLILLFCDEAAARSSSASGWHAAALRRLGIDVEVVEVPAETEAALRAAQERQYR